MQTVDEVSWAAQGSTNVLDTPVTYTDTVSTAPRSDSSQKALLIGIAGFSGSGKTTLARKLATQLGATLFPLDFYYRDLSQFPLDERHQRNFDHPDSLESELFTVHLRQLAAGQPINRPIYNFKTHSRVPGAFTTIVPGRYVIVEGILALHYAELLPLYTLSVYVDAPDEVCLTRRIRRDMRERGRSEESVREQYEAAVRPMALQYILPSRAHATITVSGSEPLDQSVGHVLRKLQEQQTK